EDFVFGDDLPIIITEKDAIKCRSIDLSDILGEVWVLSVGVQIPSTLMTSILDKLKLSVQI
ncbi:MAG: hypothetical protein HOL98_12810, partial [Gammaproteobacteria bacterium]|nr:hypothetical protein [Gammaproteobacteria bacterium]